MVSRKVPTKVDTIQYRLADDVLYPQAMSLKVKDGGYSDPMALHTHTYIIVVFLLISTNLELLFSLVYECLFCDTLCQLLVKFEEILCDI